MGIGISLGGSIMKISYNKLWKLLIDKNMNKQDLKRISGISSASIAKLGKGENITTDILLKICEALNCGINDIIDTVQ
ncbi:MAG: helix-turn-helix transcriptional regulator [Bacteroidaceae bacterium]|nr:helix-turn-helix transcriptional regulator [Bacteroidaceae bacterium]